MPRPHSDGESKAALPVVAYVPLWFPLSSETFVFREVVQLMEMGLPIRVYTMYGERLRGCSDEMHAFSGPLRRMGTRAVFAILGAFFRAFRSEPGRIWSLLREGFFRRMRNLESQAENTWCFLAGFLLAEECRRHHVALLHAPWANGPATAVWVASRLTGIPFGFTGRAGDIYPQDGLLREKARDARFIRTNNAANVSWLQSFCEAEARNKVCLVYNSLTLGVGERCAMPMQPPYRLLAVGRFVPKKGFEDLITALACLRRENVPCRLTLVGDGRLRGRLIRQIRRLGLEDCVDMPGFVPNDRVRQFLREHDMLVMPSVVSSSGNRDGIPNVIMEAFSHCMPVVATDVCGIAEVVRHGETGYLTPQHDPQALAAAIRRMLEDRGRARAMAEAGCALVRRMFDRDANIRALYDVYLSACSGQRSPDLSEAHKVL